MSLALDLILMLTATTAVIVCAARLATSLYATRPWSRVLAGVVFAAGEIVLLLEALGALRLLRPLPIALCAVAISAAVGLLLRTDDDAKPRTRLRWPLPNWATWILTTFGLGIVAVCLGRPTQNFDSLNYHYPLLATWVQNHDLLTNRTFAIGNYAWYYPSNMNLIELWSVVFTRRDFLVSLATAVWFPVAIAAIAGTGRRIGLRLLPATAIGLAFASTPLVMNTSARSGQVDVAATALLCTALFFGLCWWQERRLVDAIVGGLALGLVAGTKFVTLPYAAVLGIVFVAAIAVAVVRRNLTLVRGVQAAGAAALATALTGGFFYVRNFALTGNPAFPAPILGFKGAQFPVAFDKINNTIAVYLANLDPHPWIVGAWLIGAWLVGLLAIASLVVVPVVGLRIRRPAGADPASRETAASGASDAATRLRAVTTTRAASGIRKGELLVAGWIVPLFLAAAFVVTPTSAGGPYGFPLLFPSNMRYAFCWMATSLIGLGAAVAATAPDAARASRRVLWLCGGILATSALRFAASLVGILPEAGETTTATLLVGFVLGAGATAVGFVVARRIARRIDRRDAADVDADDDTVTVDSDNATSRAGLVIAAAAVLAALVTGGVAAAAYAHDRRFEITAPDYASVFAEINRRSATPLSIAYTAFDRSYPLYGERLQNTVRFLTHEADDRVPGQALPFTDAGEFVTAVCHADNGKPVQLFVTRTAGPVSQLAGVPLDTQLRLAREIGLDRLMPHETEWADARPELFRVVTRTADASSGIVTTIYAVNAAACPSR